MEGVNTLKVRAADTATPPNTGTSGEKDGGKSIPPSYEIITGIV